MYYFYRMNLDKDLHLMSFAARGQEIMRIRRLIRTHKKKKDNARCWLNDLQLYDDILPEGSGKAGRMNLPACVLLKNCKKYILGQKCKRKRKSAH